MATTHLNYLNRDFNSIKSDLIDYSKANYPQLSDNFGNDSSISSWIVDLLADCTDSLNYHIDRLFQNTQINSTTSRSALMNMARSNGLKVPGPKAATCEVKFSCILPVGYLENGMVNSSMPNWNAAPVIQRNTVVSAGNYKYTIDENVDFAEAFNSEAFSNRTYTPLRNSNGTVTGYTVTKTVLAIAGDRKVYKKVLSSSDVTPFMEVLLPDTNVMEIESVIFKSSDNLKSTPELSEYFVDEEEYRFNEASVTTHRFFEVNSFVDQWRWGSEMGNIDNNVLSDKYNPELYDDYSSEITPSVYTGTNASNTVTLWITQDTKVTIQYPLSISSGVHINISIDETGFSGETLDNDFDVWEFDGKSILNGHKAGAYEVHFDFSELSTNIEYKLSCLQAKTGGRVYRGQWKPLRQKYITEYTDNGYTKIIFGPGVDYTECPAETKYGQYRMSKIINNDMLGVLPKAGWTMYVLYKTGGGVETNVAAGAITTIQTMQIDFPRITNDSSIDTTTRSQVLKSLSVRNTTNGITGKDAPSDSELKYFIKYNTGAQERCVTLKDYKIRAMMMPPKYGAPFRCSVMEENNKIVLSLLNVAQDGTLYKALPSTLVNNLVNYMEYYKSINDYLEIKSGKIYNLGFQIDAFVDKSYNSADVVSKIISTVKDYMNIEKQDMGEDIFLGDLNKEISILDGVISLIDLKVYKITGNGYSSDKCPLPSIEDTSTGSCDTVEETPFTVASGAKAERIDLDSIDSVLLGDSNAMYEIKNPGYDIRVRIKQR